FIDGQQGKLLYRGYDIHDLAENAGYLETLYMLWHGDLPTREELEAFEAEVSAARSVPGGVVDLLRSLPSDANPMTALQAAVAALGSHEPDAGSNDRDVELAKATRLAAKIPTVIAAFDRVRNGHDPIEPRDDLSQAGNFLYMLSGEEPGEVAARALDTSLLLYLEHGFNASTFTCRVIASTLADLHSAIAGGIGALKGELHGGANEKAMRMILEIDSEEGAEAWVDQALSEHRKIMGFGHRVYRTEDPRATHLRRMSEELSEDLGDPKWHRIARRVEETMLDRKGINCNVDFYCGIVYYTLGIPLDLFTPLFAAGRTGGWSAHVMEQHGDNRLIRPRAEYTGPRDRRFVPIDER
ncbi:MAG TPA: citrate/2-methylcitrate synthase, partial [Gemmatimonadota bacterium]|nr:citrate/2-methylcitrate synthase [Gemmatimonadota bacterium]